MLLCSVLLMLVSCLKRNEYPIRPKVEFIAFFLNANPELTTDSIGVVKFSFTDGDGDLGLPVSDTLGVFANGQPYHKNLFVRYFEKQNGIYVEDTTVTDLSSTRFISLTPTGSDKTLEGEMDVGVFASPFSPFDTVRYEIYIVDRALHHSDTIVTPDIINPF